MHDIMIIGCCILFAGILINHELRIPYLCSYVVGIPGVNPGSAEPDLQFRQTVCEPLLPIFWNHPL